jgi:hypothetical protein
MAIAQEGYGSVFVILWLLLLAAWLVGRLRRTADLQAAPVALSWIDAVVLLFFALYIVSGVIAALRGSPRPAANVTWHWLSVGVAYFLFRQLLVADTLRRAALAALVGLAVGMAVSGLEQALVSLPDARAEYARYQDDPQQLYARIGRWLPEGSTDRAQFEARLASAEPTATFALSNSLAALLVPAVVLLVGVVGERLGTAGRTRGTWDRGTVGPWDHTTSTSPLVLSLASYGVLLAIVSACLLFTHSRSGIIAALVAGFAAAVVRSRRPIVWLVVGGLLASAGGGALYLLRPDATDAALNSFAYRVEYWQATWAMIQDFPLFGCGPGQFQDTYSAYKLPAASEEVADPHNFLFEVWATGGSPAAVVFVGALGGLCWVAFSFAKSRTAAVVTPSDSHHLHSRSRDGRNPDTTKDDWRQIRVVYLAAVGGVLLGTAAAWLDRVPLSGLQVVLHLASVVATLAILHGWVVCGECSTRLPAIAALGLLLHLTVSGGIGEPALASVLWLLFILSTPQPSSLPTHLLAYSPAHPLTHSPSHRGLVQSIVTASFTAITVALLLASYMTFYRPVLRASGQLARADQAAIASQQDRRMEAIEAACAADPRSIEAARRLAAMRFAAWQEARETDARNAWQQADECVRRLAPRRHSDWRESGQRYAELFRGGGDRNALDRAVELVERAIDLYPTHADHRLFYAELLAESGRTDEARAAMAVAIELDKAKEAAGHDDRTLSGERLQKLQELARALDVPF